MHLTSYLGSDVGSLSCLLPLSLLLLKPAVSVDCLWSLGRGRMEGGKTVRRQRDEAEIYVDMHAYIQRKHTIGCRRTHTHTQLHPYTTQRNGFLSLSHMHAHTDTLQPNRC